MNVVTESSIEAGWMFRNLLDDVQVEQLQNLVTVHGVNVHDTNTVSYDVVDMPLLTFTLFDKDSDGNCYSEPNTGKIATRTIDKPLTHRLPSWWQPS